MKSNKDFPKMIKKGTLHLILWVCAHHMYCMGFHEIPGSEGRKDAQASLYEYAPCASGCIMYDPLKINEITYKTQKIVLFLGYSLGRKEKEKKLPTSELVPQSISSRMRTILITLGGMEPCLLNVL